MNSWPLIVSMRRGMDPALTAIGSGIGMGWPASAGPARFLPLALALGVWAASVFVRRQLDRVRFRLWESAEPLQARRPRKAAERPGDAIADSRSQEELLQAYREIEKKLHAVKRKNCAFLNIDVAGSTKMKTGESPTNIAASFQAYEELLRRIFQEHHAWKQAWTPDGVLICFLDAGDAVGAAQEVLRSLAHFNSHENRLRSPFRVRCGVTAGEVAIFEDTTLATFSDPLIDAAAHLQKDARRNSLWVGESLWSALPGRADFRATGRAVDGQATLEWSLEPAAEELATPTSLQTPTPIAAANPAAPQLVPTRGAALSPERTVAVTPEAPRATRTIGRYEILEELGRGAMGAVYKANDPQIGRLVAIKVIVPRDMDPDELRTQKERFYKEARAAGKLTHPGIVALYDVAEDSRGSPYLVMEFVEGTSLDRALGPGGEGRSMEFPRRLALATQIAEALDYAHGHGVIHRDIKPANVLLARDGHPKIADFGIAKLAGSQATIGGPLLGTPAFVSPEQLTGAPASRRSDIFSLGVLLYWMFTGERPFSGDTLTAISYRVVHAMPAAPRKLKPELPEALDAILFRCIAKNPAERYDSAGDLAAALRALPSALPNAVP
jgi:class 3 adenylate cyclase/tRNA A-37 threonylcarbamoyl transferase component Bud32